MNRQQKDFLIPFDDTIEPFIIEYGKRITKYSGDYDVIILMARKAVCLAESLRLLKLTSYQSIVTSSRVLDLDLKWLQDKRVAILDDALITGTSLYKAKTKLEPICQKVDVYVLCVNEKWWAPDLVQPNEPFLTLSDERTASLCSDIVDAISLIPLPYSTDYPVYTGLKIWSEDFDSLFSTGQWLVNDVTSSLQARRGVFAKTFEPSLSMLDRLKESFGLDVRELCLMKVRLYGRQHSSHTSSFWCNLLPIIAFDPLPKKAVDSLFDSIKAFSGISQDFWDKWFDVTDDNLCTMDSCYKAKLRFIHYVMATRLASLWFESIQDGMFHPIAFQQDPQSLSFLFPYPILKMIIRISEKPGPFLAQASIPVSSVLNNTTLFLHTKDIEVGNIFRGNDGWNVEMNLTHPFLQLHDKYEIPARLRAKEHGAKIFYDPALRKEHNHYVSRLEKGFSLRDIRTWLDHLKGQGLPTQKAISQFLDRMIDRGIVVPTTCVIGQYVFRGYRHGEDVKFGEDEKQLIAHMLKSFTKAYGKETLSGVEVEKSTVLLIKRGLAEGFLVKPEKNVMGGPDTLGIRFSLHGAVVEEESTKLYSCESGCSIRDILVHSGCLQPEEVHGKKASERQKISNELVEYRVLFQGDNRNGIKINGVEEANILGLLLGVLRKKARKRSKKARLTSSELTLLATVSTPKDLAGALAAEVKWAERSFKRQVKQLEADTLAKIPSQKIENMVSFFRDRHKNFLFVSLNSGSWKYRRFISKEVWRIVERIKEGFLESKEAELSVLSHIWAKMWEKSKERVSNSISQDLNDVIKNAAEWIFSMRAYYLLVEIAYIASYLKHFPERNLLKDTEKQLEELKESAHFAAELNTTEKFYVQELSDKISNGSIDPDRLRIFALRNMRKKVVEATDILNSVDSVARNYGEPQPLLSYENCMLISFNCQESLLLTVRDRIEETVLESRTEYRKAMRGSKHSIRIVPYEYHYQKNSVMVVGYGHRELEYMIKTIGIMFSKMGATADLRVLLFHELPSNTRISCPVGTNEYFGHMFWNVLKKAISSYPTTDCDNKLIVLSGDKQLKEKKLSDFTLRQLRSKFNLPVKLDDLDVEENYMLVSATAYQANKDLLKAIKHRKVDVGIITIVSEEAWAVEAFLAEQPGSELVNENETPFVQN